MRKFLIGAGLLVLAAAPLAAECLAPSPLVEYRAEVEPGDTIWALCARVASNRDNLQEVVSRAKKENGLADARDLQPGRELIIRVKAVAE